MKTGFKIKLIMIAVLAIVSSCSKDSINNPPDNSNPPETTNPPQTTDPPETPALTESELLDLVQEETFKYFWDYAETNSGAARERYHPSDPSLNANVVTSGGSGFGLMAIIVAMERGFVSRSEGTARIQTILDFFETADRFHGAWSHWIDGPTGNALPFSAQDDGGDLVETAFLVQGLICVKEYLKDGNEEEQSLAEQADLLWKGVEWDWYTQNEDTLYWHWSPNFGFAINLELKGYNETLIAYVLGASSPDYSISAEVYKGGWASNGSIVTAQTSYGIPLILDHAGSGSGPLFWAHYSYLGLDPSNLSDQYANYWNVNVNHSKINYEYCVDNPQDYEDYGPDCWGLTASYSRNADGSRGYNAHSPTNDTGVISPTAAISSYPYTPEESLAAIRYFYSNKDQLLGPAGFYDAFSPEFNYWVAEAYLAIDQGPQIIMIENHRSGLLWDLFMANEDVQAGLDKLGFSY